MNKILRSLSLCMALLFIFQLMIPFSALAQGTLAPSLSINGEGNYTVSSVEDLNTMRSDIDKGINYAGKIITLAQDIDISQAAITLNSFTTQNIFSGCFDGRFHTISGYTDAKSGLFGLIDSNGEVRNLRIAVNVVISDAGALINDIYYNPLTGLRPYGLIANESAGPISRCSTTGTVTINDPCSVGGIAGYNRLNKQVYPETVNGKITDCFSNVIFNNLVDTSLPSPSLCGIAFLAGDSLEHCYYYGQFTGNTLAVGYKLPIRGGGCTAVTCAYDSDVLGFSNKTKSKGVRYTTLEMKTQANYTTLGFDFDKCWSIDPTINNGYPYLDPLKGESDQEVADVVAAQIAGLPANITLADESGVEAARAAYDDLSEAQKAYVNNLAKLTATEARIAQLKEEHEALIKIPVDIQVTVSDKTYDPALSGADKLLTEVTAVQVAGQTEENAALIEEYNVLATYDGVVAKFGSPTMGEQAVSVTFDNLALTYMPNDVYQFTIDKILPVTGKFLDNGQPGPTEAKQAEQVALAKRAQDILYSKLGVGQGAVPAFTWSGDKASTPGKEGTVVFNDTTIIADAWGIFSSARSGYTGVRPGYYDEWFQSVQTGLQRMKEAGIEARDVKMTEWEKLMLAITAIGYDPRDIKAYDLINIISNNAYVSTSPQYFSTQYALLALDSYHYPIPEDGNRLDTESWIHTMAEQTKGTTGADGSTVLGNAASDMWVMQFQPIAAYYDPNAQEGDKYYDVKVAMENRVFPQFSRAQTYSGYFWGGMGDINNAWTNAQVYITLGMAKADFFAEKYIKNGNSIFDGALKFYNFDNNTTEFDSHTYEPCQMGRGLDSLVRAYEGRNSIFDCTDVLDSTVLVNNAIAALPETITSANKAEVEAAQALYDALSDAKKASLQDVTKAKLVAAQLAIGGESDQAIADIVIAQIADLPLPSAITLNDQSSIQAARAAYTALNEAQKLLVTNLAILTAAEARLEELQGGGSGGDTTPPIITVKDLADQTLGENLTVAEPSFSFKVTAQDEKDGLLSPSVQLGGTALTAGTDGIYTCTLSAGINTITVTATDTADNRAEKSLSVTLGTAAFTVERVGNETFKNGQEARLKVKVSNQTASSQDAILIVALFRTDGGNKMVNHAYVSQPVEAGEEIELGAGFSIPESGTYTIKGFVWDNLDDMNALMTEPVIVEVAQS